MLRLKPAYCLCFYNHVTAQLLARKKINFYENWRFSFGHAANPAKDFNYKITAGFSKSGKADSNSE